MIKQKNKIQEKFCPRCKSKNIEINIARQDVIRDSLRNVQANMFLGSTQPIIICKDCKYEGGIYLDKNERK